MPRVATAFRYLAEVRRVAPSPRSGGGHRVKHPLSGTRALRGWGLGAVAARGVRSVMSPAGVRGTALEVAWVAAHIATYPFGMTAEKAETPAERYTLEGLP